MNCTSTHKRKGFSLVEIIISISIFSVIILIVGAFQSDVFSLNRILQTGLRNQNEARKILRPFVNEVRGAQPSDLGAYPLATVGTSTFMFYSDIDHDGQRERIRYFLDGTDFKKGIIKPGTDPVEYNEAEEKIIEVVHDVVVGDSIFTYYDKNYDGTVSSTPLPDPVTPLDVRLVRVDLLVDSDPNNPPAPLVVTTQVTIRNIKDNL